MFSRDDFRLRLDRAGSRAAVAMATRCAIRSRLLVDRVYWPEVDNALDLAKHYASKALSLSDAFDSECKSGLAKKTAVEAERASDASPDEASRAAAKTAALAAYAASCWLLDDSDQGAQIAYEAMVVAGSIVDNAAIAEDLECLDALSDGGSEVVYVPEVLQS